MLITGTGFSWGAATKDQKGIPSVDSLKTLLLYASSIPKGQREAFTLATAIEAYRDKFKDEAKLASFLRAQLWAETVAPHHEQLVSLPWYRAYTTNYDNVFEVAARNAGIEFEVFDQSGFVKEKKESLAQVIHLHGYIASTNPTDNAGRFIAGVAAYAQPQLYESDWFRQLVVDIDSAPAIFVVGNSVSDNHIARILARKPEYSSKLYFIVETAPPLALSLQLKSFGNVCRIGVDGFAKLCGTIDLGRGLKIDPPLSVVRLQFLLPPRNPVAADLDELLLKGRLDISLLHQKLHKPSSVSYFVPRFDRKQLASLLPTKQERQRFIFVHSNIGNGKSIMVNEMASQLSQQAISVFWLHPEKGDVAAGISYLSKQVGTIAVVVEDVFQYENLLQTLINLNRSDAIFVLTSRTSSFEVRKAKAQKLLNGKLFEIDANHLNAAQLADMATYLEQYGYWKDRAKLSDGQKLDYLRRRCHGEIRGILLSLLDSPTIRDRLEKYFDTLLSLPARVLEYIIIATYARVISGVQHSAYEIGHIMDIDYAWEVGSQRDRLSADILSRDLVG